jgi:hypothetical protein
MPPPGKSLSDSARKLASNQNFHAINSLKLWYHLITIVTKQIRKDRIVSIRHNLPRIIKRKPFLILTAAASTNSKLVLDTQIPTRPSLWVLQIEQFCKLSNP